MQEEKDTRGQWFVVHTLSGKENKVRDTLQRQLENEDGKKLPVYEVAIPTEKVSEVRQGKKYTTTRKIFPGYILVRMDLYKPGTSVIDEAAWYFIRNTQGIIGFIGGSDNPVPLEPEEVRNLFHKPEEEEKVKPKVLFEIGEVVRINSGAFENFEGSIEEIDNERGKLKLMVSIFGRSTPVELEFWQVGRDV
ncbi:MAG: transcription termination/antitermination protein NusG [Victivallaceae bacterium]|nr:transcription termination/antitermination protein NusG [Victivallaceae bacterium]